MIPETPQYIFDPNINPYIDIDDINSPAMQKIAGVSNYNSGDTIEEVINNIRFLPYEVIVLFDYNMRKVYEHTDYEQLSCRYLIPNSWCSHIKIMLHNHPVECTFSDLDLLAMQSNGYPTAIVVTKNFTYILHGLPNDWKSEAPPELNSPEQLETYLDAHTSFAHDFGEASIVNDFCIEQLVNKMARSGMHIQYSVRDTAGKVLLRLPYATTKEVSYFYQYIKHRRYHP